MIAVDSAFHEYGLQYGNADETVGRVLKKLVRAAFALEACLDINDADILFATPKMAEPVWQSARRHLAILEMRLAEQSVMGPGRRRLRLIANGEFVDEILTPVLDKIDLVADTAELFMRAQQLVRLCESTVRRCHPYADTDSSTAGTRNSPSPVTRQEPRIGEHVRRTMVQLAASGRLSARIVGDLLDPRYCKAKFNLGLAFLKPVDERISLSRQRIDSNGYGRYWKHPLRIGDHEFLMCSQWFVWQREAFDAWVRHLG